jgi:hypothetical protein
MNARDLQEALLKVVERTRTLDIRRYEWREQSSLERELLPAVIEALSGAINIFSQMLTHYGDSREDKAPGAGSRPPNVGPADGGERVTRVEQGVQRVTDLAFMARWELYREREGLSKIPSGRATWAIVSECGRASRRLITSAIAIEDAMCAQEGLESALRHLYQTELSRSLQVRRAYAMLHHTIVGDGPSPGESVSERLRRAAFGIARLVGNDVYGDLRASDRMRIETVQRQLTEWLETSRNCDPVVGLRLWQEVENISELLLEVNKRAELREHDQTVITEAYARLFRAGSPPDCVPHDLLLQLQSLFGRDGELDRLITDSGSHSAVDWRRPLEEVLEGLNRTKEEVEGSQGSLDLPLSSF